VISRPAAYDQTFQIRFPQPSGKLDLALEMLLTSFPEGDLAFI
jgi:hypothetical protein